VQCQEIPKSARQHALNHMLLAKEATAAQSKQTFENLAQSWTRLAAELEFWATSARLSFACHQLLLQLLLLQILHLVVSTLGSAICSSRLASLRRRSRGHWADDCSANRREDIADFRARRPPPAVDHLEVKD
jgi:hypothetical protein